MPTLMIVEDDSSLCLLYRQEFEDEGYDVVIANRGREALAVVDKQKVDVVILDIAMPGMDGIEALGKILAVDNGIPVVLNTAYPGYKEDFLTWAAEAYVVKSGDLTELKERVAAALAKRAQADANQGAQSQ